MKFIAGMMYLLLAVLSVNAWADCQVLLPEGAVRYEGGCNGSLAYGQGRAYEPSRIDPNGFYAVNFVQGKLHGKAEYIFARVNQTAVEYFYLHFGEEARVWLFGSRVNDSKRGGDVDLFVQPDGPVDRFMLRMNCLSDLEEGLPFPVDLVVEDSARNLAIYHISNVA